jgi:hypothetical protein
LPEQPGLTLRHADPQGGVPDAIDECSLAKSSQMFWQFNHRMAHHCMPLLFNDAEDRELCVDYLHQGFVSKLPESDRSGLLSNASKFVDASIAKWSSTKNQKLVDRYQRLRRYFDSRLPQLVI